MNTVRQSVFSQVPFDATRANLHTQPGDHERSAVLLVHGLNSSGYRAWGDLPQQLFDAPANDDHAARFDVAVVDYISGHRRIGRRSDGISDWAEFLTQAMKELHRRYPTYFLVCHSLGGIVALKAINTIVAQPKTTRGADEIPVPASLVTLATPFAGSLLASRLMPVARGEIGLLKTLSRDTADLVSTFENWVESKNRSAAQAGETVIATYSGRGSRDRVVSEVSANRIAPQGQRRVFERGHRSLPKPQPADPNPAPWLREVIAERLEVLEAGRRKTAFRRSTGGHNAYERPDDAPTSADNRAFCTSLRTTTAGLRYRMAYLEAIASVQTIDQPILDITDPESLRQPVTKTDLHVICLDVTEAQNSTELIDHGIALLDSAATCEILVCIVGHEAPHVANRLRASAQLQGTRGAFVEAFENISEFRETLQKYVYTRRSATPSSPRMRSSSPEETP
ncbi:esterase/lipase family protein [Cellulosimicrobium cellulans]|uniref:esterase/lipase family protein n=1 Tax=Cellulosimicrobium cellulans TaxID=1710 RepID=UPI002406B32A|nr:alpha/beta fold hydrolase [Cellulosimicrobium cellulans]MDF9878578.1 hypothetical protein [Cellulosimicrobium cellulans]